MKIRTTTELKALRQLLGLSLSEAAMLLQEDKGFLEQSERGRNWSIPPLYRDALLHWEEHVQALIDDVHEGGDSFVIVYSANDIYREFEPSWSLRLPTALMHFAAAARAKAEIGNGTPTLVMMAPKSYREYLTRDPHGKEFPDNHESRQMWAAAYCKSYRVLEPMKGAKA